MINNTTPNTPTITKKPTSSKSQNTTKKLNLQVKLPSNLLNNQKTTNEPMVLQSTNNFIKNITNTLNDDLLDIDINADLVKHMTENIYAATSPNMSMHHIMRLFGKNDLLYDYLNITVDGTKFIRNLEPRYKLYMVRIFILDHFAKYINNVETDKIICNDIVEYA